MQKNIKGIFLLTTVLLLVLSLTAIGASDVTNDNNNLTDAHLSSNNQIMTANVEQALNVVDGNIQKKETKTENTKTSKSVTVTQNTVNTVFSGENHTLSEEIMDGDTLDFQGPIDMNNSLIINKAVSITSTTHDARINLHTVAGELTGENPGNRFSIDRQASGSNISDLYFENTQFWVYNAENIYFHNLSMVVKDARVGSGVGQTSIRYSNNITMDSCYIYTLNNQGSSSFVLTGTSNTLLVNSHIEGQGNVGNIVYLGNPYNTMDKPDDFVMKSDSNIVRNCTIVTGSACDICIPIQNLATNTIIENNKIYATSSDIRSGINGTIRNNELYSGVGMYLLSDSVAYNNTVNDGGITTFEENTTGYNNTLASTFIEETNVNLTDNIIGTLSIKQPTVLINNSISKINVMKAARNSVIAYNNIDDTINLQAASVTIDHNNITATSNYAIELSSSATNAVISNNYITSSNANADNAILTHGNSGNTLTTFNNTPKATNIILTVPQNSKCGEEITVTSTIQTETSEEAQGTLTLYINDEEVKVTTENILSYTFSPATAENLNILVNFSNHTREYLPNTNGTTITVLSINTQLTLETNQPDINETLEITGTLTDENNNILPDTSITLTVNTDEAVIIKTDSNGKYACTANPIEGNNIITVRYGGNNKYNSTEQSLTLRVIDFNKILKVYELEEQIRELQRSLEEFRAKNTQLEDKIDNLTKQYDSDKTRLEEIIQNQTAENEELKEQIKDLNRQLQEHNKAKDTMIIIDEINSIKYGEKLTVSGLLINEDSISLSNQNVTIILNNIEHTVTTRNGVFTYITKADNMGTNSITVRYHGTEKYNPTEEKTSFSVDKQDVLVTVEDINEVAYGDNVTITGKFTDAAGKILSNSNVRIFVNGVKYLARTDKTGTYLLSIKATQIGENNLKVGYGGNDRYNSYEIIKTFTVTKQNVTVTVNRIEDTRIGENISVTGKFTDANDKVISNSNVKILFNGKKYLARTDSSGIYNLTVTVNKEGINNITVGYGGNDKYNEYEDTVTFSAGAQDVIITTNPIDDVILGENVTVTGKFTDKNGKAISNSVVKVMFNNKKYSVRTDNRGDYTFTAVTTEEGTNNVTVSYGGNVKYNAYECSTSFKVIRN